MITKISPAQARKLRAYRNRNELRLELQFCAFVAVAVALVYLVAWLLGAFA